MPEALRVQRMITDAPKAPAPNPAATAEAILSMAHTWRYGNAGGAIVCDCPPGCTESGGRTETFYGGHFVCESTGKDLARAIIAAVNFRRAPDFRPEIVCLCGSTRFYDAFRSANLAETLAGKIVLSIGCDFKSDQGLGLSDADKIRLDALHLRKIDLADEVLILNVGGYIGESTARELAHARSLGKRVRFLEEHPESMRRTWARLDAIEGR